MVDKVQGREVRIGHRLWHKGLQRWWVCCGNQKYGLRGKLEGHPGADGKGTWYPSIDQLCWKKTVYRWANVYNNIKVDGSKVFTSSKLYDTEEEANANAILHRRIRCVGVQVELDDVD